MAITKILHINEVDMGNPARHRSRLLIIFRIRKRQMEMFWWAV